MSDPVPDIGWCVGGIGRWLLIRADLRKTATKSSRQLATLALALAALAGGKQIFTRFKRILNRKPGRPGLSPARFAAALLLLLSLAASSALALGAGWVLWVLVGLSVVSVAIMVVLMKRAWVRCSMASSRCP